MLPQNTLISQRVKQFDLEHSQDGPGIYSSGWILYPDGALREENVLGALDEGQSSKCEPERKEKAIVHYWELSLEKAADEFHELRDNWLQSAKINAQQKYVSPPPAIPTKAAKQLIRLKKKVKECQRQLETAREAVNINKPKDQIIREETSNVYAKENKKFLEVVEGIEI